MDASNLKVGDKLLSQNNKWQTVQSISIINEPITAYDLTVNNTHTFFVATGGKYGVWVHNNSANVSLVDRVDELWAVGSPNGTALQNAQKHYKKHAKELGSKDLEHYMRQAEAFKQNLKGASTSDVAGYNEGVTRYKKNGKYIDLTIDRKIVSFGKQ